MPICIKCGTSVPGGDDPAQDQSTFICENCQDKVNLKSWKAESAAIKKLKGKATESQERRLEWITNKIEKVPDQLE